MNVVNSLLLILPTCMSIFKANRMVKVILSTSYRPRTEYL